MSQKKLAAIALAIAGFATQVAYAAGGLPPVLQFTDAPTGIAVSPAPPALPNVGLPPGLPPFFLLAPNAGQVVYIQSNLIGTNGQVAGKLFGVCDVVNGHGTLGNGNASDTPGEIRMCQQTMVITGLGTLQLSGMISEPLLDAHVPQALPIVGGTGIFQAARGQVLTTEPAEHQHGYAVYLWPF